jgi:hypothetical protein
VEEQPRGRRQQGKAATSLKGAQAMKVVTHMKNNQTIPEQKDICWIAAILTL